jgi:glutamyl-tRNA synthetase
VRAGHSARVPRSIPADSWYAPAVALDPISSSVPPVGRLAPSPTGHLHLGHARSFLLAWWHARARAGRVLMRLEDLDGPRVKPGMADAALRDLEWLGLDWDERPHLQSTGVERFRAALATLQERRLAYPCVCTRADIRTAASAPQQGDREVRYPGTCRGRFASSAQARALSGRDPGLRFAVPDGQVEIRDGFAGRCEFDVAAEVGDFLVARRDGSAAYQLAVVVDDAAQGVTEILRGDDLLPSAARQRHLQQALQLPSVAWFHVPLVVDASGRRLAKRADDLSLASLREGGTDPRAIVGWVASNSGLDVPDRVAPVECVARFDLGRVPHRPVVLDAATIAELRTAK